MPVRKSVWNLLDTRRNSLQTVFCEAPPLTSRSAAASRNESSRSLSAPGAGDRVSPPRVTARSPARSRRCESQGPLRRPGVTPPRSQFGNRSSPGGEWHLRIPHGGRSTLQAESNTVGSHSGSSSGVSCEEPGRSGRGRERSLSGSARVRHRGARRLRISCRRSGRTRRSEGPRALRPSASAPPPAAVRGEAARSPAVGVPTRWAPSRAAQRTTAPRPRSRFARAAGYQPNPGRFGKIKRPAIASYFLLAKGALGADGRSVDEQDVGTRRQSPVEHGRRVCTSRPIPLRSAVKLILQIPCLNEEESLPVCWQTPARASPA